MYIHVHLYTCSIHVVYQVRWEEVGEHSPLPCACPTSPGNTPPPTHSATEAALLHDREGGRKREGEGGEGGRRGGRGSGKGKYMDILLH